MPLVSRKGILAIAAVIDVAVNAQGRPVSAKVLASRHKLPPRHLEPILQALVRDGILKGIRGPHGGYALGRERRRISAEEILRAADIFLEAGVFIETGPHKHAVQQTFFLYVYEPGGNRVEVACAGARLVLAPDWKPIRWSEAERKKGQAWGLQTIKSFHTHGTPPVPGVAES